jgi:hypothetical protein
MDLELRHLRCLVAIVGHERRHCALAIDDPWARRRSIRLDEVSQRTVLIDRRTGTTTPDPWPPAAQTQLRDTRDIDDWLAVAVSSPTGSGAHLVMVTMLMGPAGR